MADTTRDHLANERTFLAWVRTALGLIGLGFVLARMGLFLRQIAVTASSVGVSLDGARGGQGPAHGHAYDPTRAMHAGHEFMVSGVVFLAVGTVFAAWSWWHYDRNRRAIDAGRFEPSTRSVLGLTAVVVLGSLAIVGLVVWRVVEG